MLSAAAPAAAQTDAVDSRVTFVISDDNVFAGSDDFSPTADIGPRRQNKTFFDNYDSKDTGMESKTDLVLYKRFSGPYPRIETEAALVLRFDVFVDEKDGKPGTKFLDDGSFLQASYLLGEMPEEAAPAQADGEGDKTAEGESKPAAKPRKPGQAPRLYMLMFPFNADRIRLGYSYEITWGGNPIFPKNSSGAPGLKIGWEGEKAYGFLGFKSHRQLNEMTNNLDAVYGLLGGGGVDLMDEIRWEFNGGWFQKGVFQPQNKNQPGPLDGKPITAEGASTQLTYHKGLPIETSVDLKLYRNDPNFPWKSFKPEVYAEDWSFLAATEVTYLMQNLRDGNDYSKTVLQPAMAWDVNFRVKKGFLKFTGDFVYRDLSYILFNVPSFTPYVAFPDDAQTRPEWFVDVGVDYYFEDLRLNPGIVVGYQQPATYVGNLSILDPSLEEKNTVVVRRQGDFEILPAKQAAFDILSARAFTRWDASDGMAFILEVTYTFDKNATRLARNEEGLILRQFDKPSVQNRLAVALMAQARF